MTGLEPATSGVTGRHSNQLSYTRTAVSACYSDLRWDRQALFLRGLCNLYGVTDAAKPEGINGRLYEVGYPFTFHMKAPRGRYMRVMRKTCRSRIE